MHLLHKISLATAILAASAVLTLGATAATTATSAATSGGSAGTISGTVLDPTGAVVPNATIEIHYPVSGYDRTTTSDSKGNFTFPNVPFNPYHMTVKAHGIRLHRAGC